MKLFDRGLIKLPVYSLFFETVNVENKKTEEMQLALPRHLAQVEAAYWATVILTEIANQEKASLLCQLPLGPYLQTEHSAIGSKRIYFHTADPNASQPQIKIVPADENIAARLKRVQEVATEIWGVNLDAIRWGIRDLEISFQNPELKRKLPDRTQAWYDRYGPGNMVEAIRHSRLIDPTGPLTWYRSTLQKARS